jgi:uncharacterized membrane protein
MVFDSPYFLLYLSGVVSFGMAVGKYLVKRKIHMQDYMVVLFPFIFFVAQIMISRLYFTSKEMVLSANAFNNLLTLLIVAAAYLTGILIGHYITMLAIKQVYTGENLKELVKPL